MNRALVPILSFLLLGLGSSLSAADDWPAGEFPRGADGKALNFGFESGDLSDWKVESGRAFEAQPVKGDTVAARRADMISGYRGEYWVGTYERAGDDPRGILASVPFKVTHPFASFLVGGGTGSRNCVEVTEVKSGEMIVQASGRNHERMRPVVVDLREHQDEMIQIRIVDGASGGWGHVNFDDFRFHEKRPTFPIPEQPVIVHGLPPKAAVKAMDLPPGFEVKLFASEPEIVQPIAMALDDEGRVWVAQATSYPVKRPAGEGHDQILIFEDTDRDGHFDKRTVFLDGLNLVSGLAVGFGGVWIGQPPYLMFVPDKNGDDVPDSEPQILLDGWHHEDTHETLNSFTWGPDGWLYGCHGVFTHSLVGKPGTPKEERIPINAGIWRYHPTRHVFEVFAHGTSNPWGLDYNDQGQWFLTSCVIPHMFHVIDGARYRRQAGAPFNPYTYEDIKTIANHSHFVGIQWNHADRKASDTAGGGHAHSGAMIYLGGRWPERYNNQIFMNNIHGDRWNQDVLIDTPGSGYVGDHGPDFLLANDAASQIVHFDYGPDGNVFAIDWYDTHECHTRNVEIPDRSNGRIYKICYTSDENIKPGSFMLPVGKSLQDYGTAKLVELQLHDNEWYVRHARRILQERGGDAATRKALAEIAFNHPDPTRRLRGLWALHVTGGLTAEQVNRALDDENHYVRGWAIQLSLDGRQPSPQLLERFAVMAKEDPSPVVRLYLASACGRLTLAQRRPILAGLLTHEEDVDDHNLPLMYWYATEPLAPHDMAATLDLVRDSAIPVVRAFTLRRIAEIGSDEAIAFLIEALGETAQPERQIEFLAAINMALKGRRQVPMPQPWQAVYEQLKQSERTEVVAEARALSVTFGDQEATAKMREILQNKEAPAEARSQALDSLLGIHDEALAGMLQELIRDPAVGREAIRGLAAYEDKQTPQTLLTVYPELGPAARRDVLGTLASRPAYADVLLDAVAKGTVARTDLSATLIRQLRNLNNEHLTKRLNEVWGVVRTSPAAKKKLIASFRKLLASNPPAGQEADIHLGRSLFNETCAKCHKLFGSGGEIGPELTGSNRGDLKYLLANVLDPSAVMAKDYQPDVVVTTDGRVITGLVESDTADAVTLVTENETVVVPKDEIGERVNSDTSMMPDNLWKTLSDREVRSLVTYLQSPRQVAPRATSTNAKTLFNGQDLTGWHDEESLWSVENGVIVGTSSGIKHNTFLVSDLVVDDFDLTVEVKLTPNSANSGIQFRSALLESGEMKGYQADMGAGWWGKLYEESGRGMLANTSRKKFVKPGEWNTYRIRAVDHHIQTWLNGHPCVDLQDSEGAEEGRIGLQIHAGGPLEVRFRNFKLIVDPQGLEKAVAAE